MNKINSAAEDMQEEKDFQKAKEILNKIFHHYEPTFVKMAKGCFYDMKMWFIDKNNNLHRYHVEIKTRKQNMELYDTLPITCQKYCNVKDTCKMGEKAIYISLLNDTEYYVFDLDKVDLNSCVIRNWAINDIEYSDAPKKVNIPTIFIPITQSVNNGLM